MASTVKTRKADEKLREIAIVGHVSHQILGAKLPSNKQVLEVFFYNMRFVKLDAKQSSSLVIDAVLIFWQQARVPTRRHDKCVDQLLKLYEEWKYLQKRPKVPQARKLRYDTFVDNLDDLFDIAHSDAMSLIKIDDDREFLTLQRQKGRPGSMLGIDKNLADKEERSRQRKEKEEERRSRHTQAQESSS